MFQFLRRWRQKFGGASARVPSETLILMYHRVAEPPLDPCLLCVRPSRFAEHLEVLRREYDLVPLKQCGNGAAHDQARRPRVVLTMDDGYADNLLNGKPILERYDAPATVFVTSGYVGAEREFWWDELDRLLLQPGRLPATLRLRVFGEVRAWELGDVADYPPARQEQHKAWSILDPNHPCVRHQIYRDLAQVFYTLSVEDRFTLLEELRAQSDKPVSGRSSHFAMQPEQVQELAKGGLVEIGAHTKTHPVLSAQAPELQHAEIVGSKQRLEEIVGRPVDSFAYPFGTTAHYNEDTLRLVKDAGFTRACSNFTGFVRPDADLFQLPRYMVFNWNGDEFARHVRQWLLEPAAA